MDYLGKDIPKLGFGLMRLPMIGGDVDIEQTKAMVDMFLSNGFTYFDTAYGYIDGKSEEAARTCIVDRYPRESFQLATKLPAWAVGTAEEAKKMLATSLKRTNAGYFDFYLLHNLGASASLELAGAIAAGVAYLRLLTESGLSAADALAGSPRN